MPTGTVDLPATTVGRVSSGPRVSTTARTWDRSAAPESDCGVPTHTKWTSAQSAISA